MKGERAAGGVFLWCERWWGQVRGAEAEARQGHPALGKFGNSARQQKNSVKNFRKSKTLFVILAEMMMMMIYYKKAVKKTCKTKNNEECVTVCV